MHSPLTKCHMYLEDYYFYRSQTQLHGEMHRNALFDAELHKGMTKTPTNLTQTEQNTIGKQSRSSPKPTTQRVWPDTVVKGQPTLGGGQPPLGTSLSFLAPAVECLHVEAVGVGSCARNSIQHRLSSLYK